MSFVRPLLRLALPAGASLVLVACTLITGSADLKATQAVGKQDGGKGGDDDDDDDTPGDDDDDDDGGRTSDGGPILSGAFCATLDPTPVVCQDFEVADLTGFQQEISNGGALTLETDGSGKVLTSTVPTESAYAYVWQDIGSPNVVEWSFDVDLSAVTPGFLDFNEVGFTYADTGEGCGVEPSTQAGRFLITEFCTGNAGPTPKTAMEVPHDIGEIQAGPGWHHVSVRFDLAAHTLNATFRRPDGAEGALAAGTPLNAQFTPEVATYNSGIPFMNGTTPQKIRIDNVVVRTF